jgi:hypothetical protein
MTFPLIGRHISINARGASPIPWLRFSRMSPAVPRSIRRFETGDAAWRAADWITSVQDGRRCEHERMTLGQPDAMPGRANGVTSLHPIAVMLNLVDPIGSGGWAFSRRWKAGFDKAGRSTLQHAGS